MSFSLKSEARLEQSFFSKDDILFKAHPRARNYVAKVDAEARIVLTVPFGGTRRGALEFANKHREWLLEQQRVQLGLIAEAAQRRGLRAGDFILFRGMKTRLSIKKDWGRPVLAFADQRIYIADADMELSRPLSEHLKQLAKAEFPSLVFEYAKEQRVSVSKVLVRDQKTRWGSCSTSRTISLNWRLILAPEDTRDYIILHELMHLRHFDHSAAFWRLVEKVCPRFREHELWLNEHQEELNW